MNVLFTSKFSKDLDKINDDNLLEKVSNVVEELEAALKLFDISNVKKMKGFKDYYRIKIGYYRMGIYLEKDTIYIQRLVHRKDIYSVFP